MARASTRSRSKTDDGLVEITMAHHLGDGNQFTEGGKAIAPGDTMRVRPEVASHLRGAGYATPADDDDAEDHGTVDGPAE